MCEQMGDELTECAPHDIKSQTHKHHVRFLGPPNAKAHPKPKAGSQNVNLGI